MKNKAISVRLSEPELVLLDKLSRNANLSQSEYIRFLIRNGEMNARPDRRQLITAMLCKIYVLLVQKGLEKEDVTKEVIRLCQIL